MCIGAELRSGTASRALPQPQLMPGSGRACNPIHPVLGVSVLACHCHCHCSIAAKARARGNRLAGTP